MTIAQVANPFIQTVFIVIIGLGYYFTIKTLSGSGSGSLPGAYHVYAAMSRLMVRRLTRS
jgi:hypothetical protein